MSSKILFSVSRSNSAREDTATTNLSDKLYDYLFDNQKLIAINEEISSHFAFEEDELFTRLEEMGDLAIGEHLRGEHRALLPLGKAVDEIARSAIETGFTDESWTNFRNIAGELVERMFVHIQKEEMALLPALDDLLDDEADMELSTAYSESH